MRPVEVSISGFERNEAMMTDQACVEHFRFNHGNLEQVVPLIA